MAFCYGSPSTLTHNTNTWGMCMWTGLSEQAKNVKYFHHRVISVENFNDQVEKNNSFCGYHSTSFPSHSCHCPNGSWAQWPQWRDEGLHGLSMMSHYNSSRPSRLQSLLNAQSVNSREQYWVPHMGSPRRQLPCVRLIILHCFCHRKGSALFEGIGTCCR